MSTEQTARDVVDMLRAHTPYMTGRTVSLKVACAGVRDPLTGHWCQFIGTPKEHYEHQIERVAAMLAEKTLNTGGSTHVRTV